MRGEMVAIFHEGMKIRFRKRGARRVTSVAPLVDPPYNFLRAFDLFDLLWELKGSVDEPVRRAAGFIVATRDSIPLRGNRRVSGPVQRAGLRGVLAAVPG